MGSTSGAPRTAEPMSTSAETRCGAASVKSMAKAGWQVKKQGILLVAEITDGEHAGTKHIYDGGTRLRLGMRLVGPDYVMPCWVEDLTLAEAAEKFDIFNSESKKPSPYDHYKVGIAYHEPHQTAIKRARQIALIPYVTD